MQAIAPKLETERLILRGPQESDLDQYAAMMADEDVVRFIGGCVMDRADAWRNMAMVAGHWHFRGFGFFALEEKATGHFVGRVGPWMPESWPDYEIGWTLNKNAWGKGFATEAAVAAIEWSFAERSDLRRVISIIDENNLASQAVAARIGETQTDETFEYKGGRYPIWAVTRTAWEAGAALC